MTEGEKFVTVDVSIELLAQLQDEWSPPVELQIERTSTGYTLIARTHTCEPCSCFVISDVNDYCPQHGRDT